MKTKLVECSLGIRTTEEVARKVDEVVKGLPRTKEFEFRRKGGTDTTEVEQTSRTDVSYINTAAMDRDREIITPEGVELEDFRSNPVVLFSHDKCLPCGKCLWIKSDKTGLLAKTYYPTKPASFTDDWLPDFVFSMVAADVMRGKSVGILPLEIRDPNDEEASLNPELRCVISRSLLMEYSVVSIPSNPAALVESIGKGIGLAHWGYKVVGHINKTAPKKIDRNKLLEEALHRLQFDPDKIAAEVAKKIQARWDV